METTWTIPWVLTVVLSLYHFMLTTYDFCICNSPLFMEYFCQSMCIPDTNTSNTVYRLSLMKPCFCTAFSFKIMIDLKLHHTTLTAVKLKIIVRSSKRPRVASKGDIYIYLNCDENWFTPFWHPSSMTMYYLCISNYCTHSNKYLQLSGMGRYTTGANS